MGSLAAPGGTYLSGPAGVVTDHGAFGPGGHGGGVGFGLGITFFIHGRRTIKYLILIEMEPF